MNLSPRKALNPAFLKLKPHRDDKAPILERVDIEYIFETTI